MGLSCSMQPNTLCTCQRNEHRLSKLYLPTKLSGRMDSSKVKGTQPGQERTTRGRRRSQGCSESVYRNSKYNNNMQLN
jgi:hypothetical protein